MGQSRGCRPPGLLAQQPYGLGRQRPGLLAGQQRQRQEGQATGVGEGHLVADVGHGPLDHRHTDAMSSGEARSGR